MVIKTKIKQELKTETKIKREITRLNNLYKNMDKNLLKIVNPLIENAAFMSVTLKELQEDISKNGVVEEYQNGANQSGMKKSPAVEVYNTMIKNYSAITKQLTDLLPKEAPKPKSDGLDEFLNG